MEGKVEEVGLFLTTVVRPDNRTQFVPNGEIGTITNFTMKKTHRVDAFFTLEHDGDFLKAKSTLLRVAKDEAFVLSDPVPPNVLIHELSTYGVQLKLRVWVAAENQRKVPYILKEKGLLALQASGIALARTKYK